MVVSNERNGMEVQRRLMVVGAMPGNLGMRVALQANQTGVWGLVQVYDINGSVNRLGHSKFLNIRDRRHVVEALETFSPTDIVCTVGTNYPEDRVEELSQSMNVHVSVNLLGPIQLLQEALDLWTNRWGNLYGSVPETGFNFCAVSSNSAHIARSKSAGYCASKAALSMALRCVARREAEDPITIWGYEPGFIVGTPMSQKTMDDFPDVPLHRIPGDRTIDADDLAEQIVADLINAHDHMNGCMYRIDGGEQ